MKACSIRPFEPLRHRGPIDMTYACGVAGPFSRMEMLGALVLAIVADAAALR